jgi:hypothetical protein
MEKNEMESGRIIEGLIGKPEKTEYNVKCICNNRTGC